MNKNYSHQISNNIFNIFGEIHIHENYIPIEKNIKYY